MSNQDRFVEASFGVISKVGEYAAEGMKDPNAIKVTKQLATAVKDNSEVAKASSNAVGVLVAGAGSLAASTSAGAAIVAAAPTVAVLTVVGLAGYGAVKLAEKLSSDS